MAFLAFGYTFRSIAFTALGVLLLASNIVFSWGLPYRRNRDWMDQIFNALDPEDDETASKRMIANIYGMLTFIAALFCFMKAGGQL
jgi:hypothetical protein